MLPGAPSAEPTSGVPASLATAASCSASGIAASSFDTALRRRRFPRRSAPDVRPRVGLRCVHWRCVHLGRVGLRRVASVSRLRRSPRPRSPLLRAGTTCTRRSRTYRLAARRSVGHAGPRRRRRRRRKPGTRSPGSAQQDRRTMPPMRQPARQAPTLRIAPVPQAVPSRSWLTCVRSAGLHVAGVARAGVAVARARGAGRLRRRRATARAVARRRGLAHARGARVRRAAAHACRAVVALRAAHAVIARRTVGHARPRRRRRRGRAGLACVPGVRNARAVERAADDAARQARPTAAEHPRAARRAVGHVGVRARAGRVDVRRSCTRGCRRSCTRVPAASGVVVRPPAPLHVDVAWHTLGVHAYVVPPHTPAVQWSPCVQLTPSLHAARR